MRKKCKVGNVSLSYYEQGSGQPIVFLHGWGRTHEDFLGLINSFNDDYRIIAIDLPGHGESEEPVGELSLDGLSKMITEFFTILKIDNPILVCHSFGARIAIKLASAKVVTNKLIFTGGAGIEQKSLLFKLKVAHYKFMKLLVKTPLYRQYREDLFANSGSVDYKNASETMKRVMSLAVSEDLTPLLKFIENDTLLFWGEADDATPLWQGELMHKEIRNSTFISKPNLTHYAFLEAADQFNDAAQKFIGGELNE